MKKVKDKANTSFAGKKERYFFIIAMLFIPLVFYAVFNIGVKFNSVLLSLKKYDAGVYRYYEFGSLFENFRQVFLDLSDKYSVVSALKNSILFYLIGLFITMPLSILTTYVIYKKLPGSKFFTVMAYLPHMLSTIIMSLMFKYLADNLLPYTAELLGLEPIEDVFGGSTKLGVLIYFNCWMSLGANVILYLGAMTRIPEDLIEVGELEGITLWKEFWVITFPLIFPTITVFIVAGVAGLFTNQCYIYNFYGEWAKDDINTLGYYMFTRVVGGASRLEDYPYASAFGVLFTLIAAPLTLLVKYVLEKFGPGAEF